jgi:kinesin family protein 20/kinesin family protein 23
VKDVGTPLDLKQVSNGEVETDHEADITIIEDDEDSEEDASDPFVDMLVEKHEELRQKLYAAELRCASIEAQVREEMANEMEVRLLQMQELYNRRIMRDTKQNEQFINRKIDLLVQTSSRDEANLESDSDTFSSNESLYEEEAEVEHSLMPKRNIDINRSDFDDNSIFDSATEGEEADDNGAAIASSGRDLRSSPKAEARSAVQVEEYDEENSDDDDEEDEENEDEDEEDDDEEDEESDEDAAEESGLDASDSSFDITSIAAEEIESADEAPATARRSGCRSTLIQGSQGTAARSRASTSTARARRPTKPRASSREASILIEAPALTDLSDASMIAEETATPKKKRKLRKKATVQEDEFVEQLGDSSLVEAVFQNMSSNTSRSFGSRKSLR